MRLLFLNFCVILIWIVLLIEESHPSPENNSTAISEYRKGRYLAHYRYPVKHYRYPKYRHYRYKWIPHRYNKYKIKIHAHPNRKPSYPPVGRPGQSKKPKNPIASKPKKKPTGYCVDFGGVCGGAGGNKCCGQLKCQARTPGGRWRYNGKRGKVCRH